MKKEQIHHEVLVAVRFLGHLSWDMLTLIILTLNILITKYFIAWY